MERGINHRLRGGRGIRIGSGDLTLETLDVVLVGREATLG